MLLQLLPSLLAALPPIDPLQDPPELVLRAVTVIDVEEGRALPDRTVFLAEGKIARIESGVLESVPPTATVVDGTGLFLVPGLIDAHVHYLSAAPSYGPLMIANGVTLARDTGAPTEAIVALRDALRSGAALGPELIVTGAIIDGDPPVWPFSKPCDTEEEVRDAVVELAEAGVDQIKVYSLLAPELYRAAIDEAHGLGLPVVGHVPNGLSILDAVAAGQDGVEHLLGFDVLIAQLADDEGGSTPGAQSYFARWTDLPRVDPTELERAYTTIARSGMVNCPTLVVMAGIAQVGVESAQDPELLAYAPPQMRSFWETDTYRAMARQTGPALPHMQTVVRGLHAAGATLVVGTDLANPYVYAGFSVHTELRLLQEAGLSAHDALRAATVVPAAAFGVADRLGTIAVGKAASMFLCRANPLADVRNAAEIEGVFLRGRYFDRAALDEMLAGAAHEPAAAKPVEATQDTDAGAPDGLVSDFDGGDLAVGFGAGWSVSTDSMMGGSSTAELTVVDGGAEGSAHALRIAGEVAGQGAQTWAGALFSPGPSMMVPADLSSKEALSFWAKGDGQSYAVMLFIQSQGFMPILQMFATEDEWKLHRFPLAQFGGTDGHDVTGLFFGAGGQPGPFALQIDSVLFEEPAEEVAETESVASVQSQEADLPVNNLVHPPGYRTAPLGSLGAVEILGSGARDAILIPGFGLGANIFRSFARANESRYRMLLVTPAGFGGTPAPPMPAGSISYGERTWCRAFEQAVWAKSRELDLERPLLIAYSDGVQHALRIALEHPDAVAGIVSIAGEPYRELGWPVSSEERPGFIDTRMARNWFKTVSPATWRQGMGRPAWYSASAEVGEQLFEASLEPTIPTMVRYYCEKWSYDPRPKLDALQVPILALLPDPSALAEDPLYQGFLANAFLDPWKAFEERESVTLVTIDGARMGLLLEQTETVSDEIAIFEDGLDE